MPNTDSPSISILSTPVRPQSLISVFTHSDHVFLGLPFPLGPGSGRSVTDLMRDMARCTCPYHLSRPLQRTAVISLMPSFWSSETEDVSTRSLVPQIQRIMARPLRQSCFRSKMFQPHVSLPWSIAEQTQVVHTLLCTLGERCLEVRAGSGFLNFTPATQHLTAMALITCNLQWATSP